MPDPYDFCPCGSGKKFKWCCQPIYPGIQRALELNDRGQHESALRLMDELSQQHPDHPEVWGQKAQLLYANERPEEAEKALDKAFELFPEYPYGLYLRAVFRLHEGEFPGAVLLARRAAEGYHAALESDQASGGTAAHYLAQVYGLIFECEMKLNRPLAAHAALRLIAHFLPGDPDVRTTREQVFGPGGNFPESARREYALLSPDATTEGPRRRLWDQALARQKAPRLSALAKAFEELTGQDERDAAAWYNLGLARAWLGDNAGALAALDRHLELEPDEDRAEQAATLAEVLRMGAGLEDGGDYRKEGMQYRIRDPKPVQELINGWIRAHRFVPMESGEQGVLVGVMLETTASGLITVGAPAADVGRYAGTLVVVGPMMAFTSTLHEPFERIREEMRQALSIGLGEAEVRTSPASFNEVTNEALFFPFTGTEEEKRARLAEQVRKHYEEVWLHRPRRVLANNTPLDAAGHPGLRKKLRGVVRFIQECAARTPVGAYDFDALRRKLGLKAAGGPGVPPGGGPVTGPQADITAMGAAELSALKPEELGEEQLERAWQTAVKLDAGELAAHFARGLASRPPAPGKADRYPVYSYLIQHALGQGDTDAALDAVNEGERADCEHNEGRRRNDYELRRGQLHVRRREPEAAADVFRRLIERSPDDPRYRATAAEGMLSLGDGPRALEFAEAGVEVARRQNDRDTEQHLLELVASSKRLVGG